MQKPSSSLVLLKIIFPFLLTKARTMMEENLVLKGRASLASRIAKDQSDEESEFVQPDLPLSGRLPPQIRFVRKRESIWRLVPF